MGKDVPFANLLQMSFTGMLYPLQPVTEEKNGGGGGGGENLRSHNSAPALKDDVFGEDGQKGEGFGSGLGISEGFILVSSEILNFPKSV